MNCSSLRHLFANYPFSWCCIVFIWVLCLIPLPETPLSEVRFFDKWTHLVFYGGLCTVIWTEYGRRHSAINWKRVVMGAIVAPLIMGALIEVVQATCTFGIRSGDVIDWVADAVGVALGQVIGIPLAHWLARRNKG
ncbi:MAG: VanZ family protein [Prevotella sp.]|nr:VanZ family protein [Prevotella sp.]